jgi:hypothetical protein
LTYPDSASLVDPLCFAKRVKKETIFFAAQKKSAGFWASGLLFISTIINC